MKTILLVLMAVAVVGCSKKNPPKPKDLEDVRHGYVVPVKPERDYAPPESDTLRPFGVVPEQQRLDALHADAMRRYESEMAEMKRAVEKWQREREREERDYDLAMEEWYNSLVVCLHCGSDLVVKGPKVCAECGREQREVGIVQPEPQPEPAHEPSAATPVEEADPAEEDPGGGGEEGGET